MLYKTQKHKTKVTKCAVQTNQQVKGCQSLSSQTILEMLNQLSLYSLVIKYNFNSFLPVRRYASAGLCDSDVSVCLSICLSHAGTVPSRAKAGS